MKWQQGRDRIEGMLTRAELERVPANRKHADLLLSQAYQHLKSAQAILENQGLRATSRGGHIAVLDAVFAQLDPPLGTIFRPFDRLRRRRNQAEYPASGYPASGQPGYGAEEVGRDLPKVQQIVDATIKVVDEMSPF